MDKFTKIPPQNIFKNSGGNTPNISNKGFNNFGESLPQILNKSPFFGGIDSDDLPALLSCLGAEKKEYDKNSFIFSAGDKAGRMGVVLSGTVHILQEDFWGNRSIFALVGAGELFGEAFTAAGLKMLPVSVFSATKTEILLIDAEKLTTVCPSACAFHTRLVHNIVRILARKNVILTQKAELLSRRSTREKLLAYLSMQARLNGKDTFIIPLNRQQLADYLSVDRSAMSLELSKMQSDGILSYHLNSFKLFKS